MPDLLAEIRAAFEHQIEVYGPLLQGDTPPGPPKSRQRPLRESRVDADAAMNESAYDRIKGLIPGNSLLHMHQTLSEVEEYVRTTTLIALDETRINPVFGVGHPGADLMVIGEAPGADEDAKGEPFVGRAGKLLTKILQAIGFEREDVYIANILKSRPPNNRDPSADEILACAPYLREQLATIQPEVLVALGAPAAKTLLNTAQSIGKLRGRFHDYYLSGMTGTGASIPLMPTYHPAYLLRSPSEKGKAWADLQLVMQRLGLSGPTSGASR